MIGTSHEVEARLLRAERDCKLEESIVLEGRPELPDGRPAPLTITQLDDLLGERTNQTRIVLGTPATGVTDVGDTLRTVTGRIADWTLPPIGKPSAFKQELTGGHPRERRVIISDFARYPVKPETCREAVTLAETLLPSTPGVARTVVLVTDPRQLDLWRTLLMGEEQVFAAPVVLRRHDQRSLRNWAQQREAFNTEERLERLHALTGGWPWLVDRAHRLHGELGDPDEVLRRLAGMLTDRSTIRAFVEATGVYAHPTLAAGYQAVAGEFQSGLAEADEIVTAIAYQAADEEAGRWVFACLDALQGLTGRTGGCAWSRCFGSALPLLYDAVGRPASDNPLRVRRSRFLGTADTRSVTEWYTHPRESNRPRVGVPGRPVSPRGSLVLPHERIGHGRARGHDRRGDCRRLQRGRAADRSVHHA
ncbi:hypothetical protein [Streptomyces mirabilis]|uniref:hypothetical protein n=1 Tax=Streptomyces mirabilis TaxID=68239 RepID=UPI00367FBF45